MTELIWVAVITGISGLIVALISGIFLIRANKAKRLGNNPHPCKDHADAIKELDGKIDDLRERVSRIEGKLNGPR